MSAPWQKTSTVAAAYTGVAPGIDSVPALAAEVGLGVSGVHRIGKRVVASLAVA